MFLTLSQFYSNFCPSPPIKDMFKMLLGTSATFLENNCLENINNLGINIRSDPNLSLNILINKVLIKRNECTHGYLEKQLKQVSPLGEGGGRWVN